MPRPFASFNSTMFSLPEDDEQVTRSVAARIPFSLCLCVGLPMAHATAASSRPPLIPQPREFTARHNLSLADGVRVIVPAGSVEDRFAAENLKDELKVRGIHLRESAQAVRIYLLRDESVLARPTLQHHGVELAH